MDWTLWRDHHQKSEWWHLSLQTDFHEGNLLTAAMLIPFLLNPVVNMILYNKVKFSWVFVPFRLLKNCIFLFFYCNFYCCFGYWWPLSGKNTRVVFHLGKQEIKAAAFLRRLLQRNRKECSNWGKDVNMGTMWLFTQQKLIQVASSTGSLCAPS